MSLETKAVPVVPDTTTTMHAAVDNDSLAVSTDSLAIGTAADDVTTVDGTVPSPVEPEVAEVSAIAAEQTTDATAESDVVTHRGERAHEEFLTHASKAKDKREYTYLSGFGVFTSLGEIGPPVFSSGFALMLTGVLVLLLGVLCVALPIINLYGLFGLRGKPDEVAIKLKKYLKLNWLPLILFLVVATLSFIGADYADYMTQEGGITEIYKNLNTVVQPADSTDKVKAVYDVSVFFGSLTWGMFIALAASMLVAVKGIEI